MISFNFTKLGGVPLYGVQLNLNPSSLPSGWALCYSDTYDVKLTQSGLVSILNTCSAAKLMLGCRIKGDLVLIVAAMGLRADVLYNCSTAASCTNVANGVGWYYSNDYSWGFASGSDTVSRSSCDTNSYNTDYRLCWHTGGSDGGYRCGRLMGLNSNSTIERVIYHGP